MSAATPAEWAAAGSLGVSAIGLVALALAFAEADADYFDPRPAARRAVAAVHQVAVHVGHDCNRALATSLRTARALRAEAAWTVAALLILTIPTGDR